MATLQAPGVDGPKLDTPEANRFMADNNATLSQNIFDIPVAEAESEVEPDDVADDIGWETVAFINVHMPILAEISDLTCQYPCGFWPY